MNLNKTSQNLTYQEAMILMRVGICASSSLFNDSRGQKECPTVPYVVVSPIWSTVAQNFQRENGQAWDLVNFEDS